MRRPATNLKAIQEWIEQTYPVGSTVKPKQVAAEFIRAGGSCSAALVNHAMKKMVEDGRASQEKDRGVYTLLLRRDSVIPPPTRDERLASLTNRARDLAKQVQGLALDLATLQAAS